MKKIAKLSLVAAVAVAGLTNVNAASLEEAIKGVDVSGQFRFRAQENTAGASNTDVEVEVGVKVPVNDNVTAVFKIDTTRNSTDGAYTTDYLDIEDYYFSYVNGAVTVNAGQQNIPGRLTDGKQGNGLVALYNAGAFTVGAAAYMDTNLPGVADKMLTSVIAMGNVGPVSLLAQYADIDNIGDSYNIKADATVGPVKVGAEYVTTDVDGSSNEYETTKAYVSGNAGIVSATLAYVATGKDGSGSTQAVLDTGANAQETASEFQLWQMYSAKKSDLSAFAIDASVAVTDKISIRAAYADGEVTAANTDVSETLAQISYQVSKNLNTYVRYSQYEVGSTENDRGRVEVRYSF